MEIGNIIIVVALFYGIIGFIEGFIDGKNSLNGRDIEHKFSFLIRCLGSVFIWGGLVYIGIVLPILIIPIILLTNSVGVDTGFNKSVGYHIGYIGKTSEWDKFIRKTPIGADGVLYQICKIVIAAVLFIISLM